MAIELISEHVKRQLAQRAACLREKMGRSQTVLRKHPSPLPSPEIREAALVSNVILMEQTTQLQGIYTMLRDETSMRVDFIFNADRLATLICERSMCELPFRPRTVTCPTAEPMAGKELDAQVSVAQLPKLYECHRLCPCGHFAHDILLALSRSINHPIVGFPMHLHMVNMHPHTLCPFSAEAHLNGGCDEFYETSHSAHYSFNPTPKAASPFSCTPWSPMR